MINFTKKWWLLGCHRRAERHISTTGSGDGSRVLLSQTFFINGDGKEKKGLIHKHNPYVRFRLSWFRFWEREYDEERLKVDRHAVNDLYETCVDEGYITKEAFSDFPTVANARSYNISGFLGYFQGLLGTYDKVWTTAITILIAIIGSAYFASRFSNNQSTEKTAAQAVPPIFNVYVQPQEVPKITETGDQPATRPASR